MYQQDVDRLPRRPRVWVLFNHVHDGGGADERRLLLHMLDRAGVQRYRRHSADCFAYLYDLSAPPPPLPPPAATTADSK